MKKFLAILTVLCMMLVSFGAFADSHPVSDVFPGALVGRTFAYDEVVQAFGFTVHWTLTFDDDTTATLIAPNDMMGDSVYACSWKFDDGLIETRINEITKGQAPLADFFDAADRYFCQWVLTDADSSMVPLSLADSSDTAAPVQDGFPGGYARYSWQSRRFCFRCGFCQSCLCIQFLRANL